MIVPSARVNNANRDTLTEDALIVELAHARRVVGSVIRSSRILDRLQTFDRRQGDAGIVPHASDTREVLQSVNVMRVRLDAGAGEDVGLEIFDDLDIFCEGDVAASLCGALRCGISKSPVSTASDEDTNLGVFDDKALGDRDRGVAGLSLGGLTGREDIRASQRRKRKQAGDAKEMHLGVVRPRS